MYYIQAIDSVMESMAFHNVREAVAGLFRIFGRIVLSQTALRSQQDKM